MSFPKTYSRIFPKAPWVEMLGQTSQLTSAQCSVVSDSLGPHGLEPTSLLCPWDFHKQEYWSRLPLPPPGVFLTQESNLCLLYLLHYSGFFTHWAIRETLPSKACDTYSKFNLLSHHLCRTTLQDWVQGHKWGRALKKALNHLREQRIESNLNAQQ